MSISDKLSELLALAKSYGAEAADGLVVESTDINISQRMGNPEGIERSESSGLGLRVFVNGSQASVSSSDMGADALKEMASRAVAMARLAPADADSQLAPAELFPKEIKNLDLCDAGEPSPSWLLEQCKTAEDSARSVAGITNSEGADAGYSRLRYFLATSNGFMGGYESSFFSLSVSVLAGEGTGMERDYDFSSTRFRADLRDAGEIGFSAANRAIKRLNPSKVTSCNVPVVFDPRVSKSLVSILTGSISGSSIARGASFLKDDMGKQIFAEGISIIDDPHRPRGFASKPFDMEGVANQKTALVAGGVLKTWLLDICTANKLGLKTTGHAARGLSSPPSPSATNAYMAAGKLSPKELISDIKSGLYLTETFGMGINTVTGDYSQGAAGFWIENGEIAYPVSEITIAGNLRDMFKNLCPASDLRGKYDGSGGLSFTKLPRWFFRIV
jgi:PmbA protein